jgi:hypothetical protein
MCASGGRMEYLLEILGSGSLKKHGRRDDRLQIQMYLSFHYSEKRMIDEFTLILFLLLFVHSFR